MTIYAEFFLKASDSEGACGDRAILQLDARVRVQRMHEWAVEWAHKHNFEAYRLIQGVSLLDTRPITTNQTV